MVNSAPINSTTIACSVVGGRPVFANNARYTIKPQKASPAQAMKKKTAAATRLRLRLCSISLAANRCPAPDTVSSISLANQNFRNIQIKSITTVTPIATNSTIPDTHPLSSLSSGSKGGLGGSLYVSSINAARN